ncbi:MAG: ComEC family competence protein, partial [Bacteroidota bacterium]|nr:ComEC family competence protein [Bacteroidota bacterium]
MAKAYKIYIWKTAPYLRLLLSVIAGIVSQYYFAFDLKVILVAGLILVIFLLFFRLMPLAYRFKWSGMQGIFISLFMVFLGLIITWQKDVRNHATWYGNYYDTSSYILANIIEPPLEKAKSFKALATVEAIIKTDSVHSSEGNILLYFAKGSSEVIPLYGDKILIKKDLQSIKNSGNPGAFNYSRYSAFHQIFHQAYLTKNDWLLQEHTNAGGYKSYIFNTQQKVRDILYKYIPGNDEKSIAAALLIGYKVDLDKDLVQAYSNAGIVHLIAISGLHMGIIYGILFWIFSKIPLIKRSKITRLILILLCLWFFALLTGASGSVLRSALMFSFIAIGLTINKKAAIYNSMAASAFLLLCYNPYLLWDVGFQLSYFAVLGIV